MIDDMCMPHRFEFGREASERIMKVMKMTPRRIYTGDSLYGINSDDLEIDPEVLALSIDINEYLKNNNDEGGE